MPSEPRLVRVDDMQFQSKARAVRWAAVQVGMSLANLRALGIPLGEMRFLEAKGFIGFDAPLPARVPRLPRERRRKRARPEVQRQPPPPRREFALFFGRWHEGKLRPCMCCQRQFVSLGVGHRLCNDCCAKA